MRKGKICILLFLAMVIGAGAQTDCREKSSDGDNKKPMDKVERGNGLEKIEPAVFGQQSGMDRPMVLVSRTDEMYMRTKRLFKEREGFPEVDFSKEAVVAVFAGEKPTGGFGISIEGSLAKARISLESPPEDAMVTQAITSPYAVFAVPVGEEQSLSVELGENWTAAAEQYRIEGGLIRYSGGFVGKEESFEPKGTISILRSGALVTLIFDIDAEGVSGAGKADDIASGMINADAISIQRLEAASLIEQPHPPFRIEGSLDGDSLKLTLSPGKRGFVVNDGFEGRGTIEARKL